MNAETAERALFEKKASILAAIVLTGASVFGVAWAAVKVIDDLKDIGALIPRMHISAGGSADPAAASGGTDSTLPNAADTSFIKNCSSYHQETTQPRGRYGATSTRPENGQRIQAPDCIVR